MYDARKTRSLHKSVGIAWGSIEPDEKTIDALKREIKEELGSKIELSKITPWTFRDDLRVKLYPDGKSEKVYMIYLIFYCKAIIDEVVLNEKFNEFKWVKIEDLIKYYLNDATRITFEQMYKG